MKNCLTFKLSEFYTTVIIFYSVDESEMTEPARPLKIFVSGDVVGKVNSLFNRINSIQAKMGNFDILFCVGNFFGKDMSQWLPYKNGEKNVPVTTYILGEGLVN